jgi:hypothetical protein
MMKFKFINRKALKKVLDVFTFATVITLFGGFYLLGLMQGYQIGQKATEDEFLAYLEDKIITRKSSLTPSPTISPLPTPIPKRRVVTEITWGGPELWTAINEKRVEYGVNPLENRTELCTIASIRLNELLELGKLDNHEGFSSLREERKDLDWIFDKYSTIAEFLAVGGKTPDETVSLWDNTLGHKKLLTGGEYVWGCVYAQNTFSVAITAF